MGLAQPVARAALVDEAWNGGRSPRIGSRPVSEVSTADVLEILSPTWHVKAATAPRSPGAVRGAGVKGASPAERGP